MFSLRFTNCIVLVAAFLLSFFLVLTPYFVSAQSNADPIIGGGNADPTYDVGNADPAPTCEGGNCLRNPLDSSISSIPAFFLAILDILLVFAVPFVVLFIVYAGFMYVTARGNPGKIQQAHMALLYALIGGVLIFGARAILNIITNTVNSVT